MKPKNFNTITELSTFQAAFAQFLDKVPGKPPALDYTTVCSPTIFIFRMTFSRFGFP